MILDIQKGTDNTILRTKSESVHEVSRELKKLIRDMKTTIRPANGIGLAAPQVGYNVRIILINIPSEYYDSTGFEGCSLDQNLILINPVITQTSPEQTLFEEGCLSLPNFYAEVMRPSQIEFQALLENGQQISGKARSIFARVIQHEIDHIDGTLFIDKVYRIAKKKPGQHYI